MHCVTFDRLGHVPLFDREIVCTGTLQHAVFGGLVAKYGLFKGCNALLCMRHGRVNLFLRQLRELLFDFAHHILVVFQVTRRCNRIVERLLHARRRWHRRTHLACLKHHFLFGEFGGPWRHTFIVHWEQVEETQRLVIRGTCVDGVAVDCVTVHHPRVLFLIDVESSFQAHRIDFQVGLIGPR